MPALIAELLELLGASLSRLFATRLGAWVAQALAWFGISWVSSKFVADDLISALSTYFSGVPADILDWISYFNVDRALTTVLSAYATVSVSKWVMRVAPPAASTGTGSGE